MQYIDNGEFVTLVFDQHKQGDMKLYETLTKPLLSLKLLPLCVVCNKTIQTPSDGREVQNKIYCRGCILRVVKTPRK